MTNNDTSSFFTTHQSRDVPRDQWGRYELPDPTTGEKMKGWTRATTFAATMAEQYGLSIWKQRQVVWGLSRRPDLLTMAQTISGPEDKKALGAIVDEAHIAAGTQSKANRGTAIHSACHAAERGAFEQVPEELRPHIAGYFAALKEHRLEVIPGYVERTVIVKSYHVAGTFDNLVRCPDGKMRVLDKKTGRLDYSDVEFAIQMALYANADAIFNYDTGRYEPMPEVAKDYAILMHIDPETGKAHPERVNITWGWTWARTSAEVMAIRKTKSIITPYVPVSSPDADEPALLSGFSPVATQRDVALAPLPPIQKESGYDTLGANVGGPVGMLPFPGVPMVVPDPEKSGFSFPAFEQSVRERYGPTAQVTWTRSADGQFTATVDKSSVDPYLNNGNPQDYPARIPDEDQFRMFWSDDRHDTDLEPAELNGVPVAEYGKPNTWPCSRGEACEFTGTDGLHSDGTVCLVGNARLAPIPPGITITQQGTMLAEDITGMTLSGTCGCGGTDPGGHVDGCPNDTHESGEPTVESQDAAHAAESNFDDLVAKVDGLKGGKAAVQSVARRLMAQLGIADGAPNAIKLSQYKVKIARSIVTLATAHGATIPGPKDGEPDIGTPSGPAPTNSVSGSPAQKASAERSGDEVTREQQLRTAVESIRMQNSIEGLTERHDYYAQTSLGWTEEMQNAARTRAAELDAESGQTALSPLEMIQGATSRETLAKAYQKATNGGTEMAGWTEQLNAAAIAKQTELSSVATSGNQ